MGECTNPTEHVAKKAHQCSICGLSILPGTRYERWRWFDQRDAFTVKVHPDCYGLLHDNDINEWFTGDTIAELLDDVEDEAAALVAAFKDRAL